jgi:hypothetical protein
MERILVDNLIPRRKGNKHNIRAEAKSLSSDGKSNHGTASTTRKKRKTRGWLFRSTVRCSTYRPPTTAPSHASDDRECIDKGLTYHDFHLAMSIDVEANREELKRLFWSDDVQH